MSHENPNLEDKKVKVSKLDSLLNIISVASIVVMVALVFYNAVLRYVFNSGLTAAEEVSRFAFVWLCYLGIILAAREGSHVSVTIITDMLHGATATTVRVIKDIVVIVTMGIVLYGGYLFTMNSNYKTAATQTDFRLITVSLVLAAFSMVIITIIDMIKSFLKSGSKEDK